MSNPKKAKELKTKADQAFSTRNWEKALTLYTEFDEESPNDPKILQRMAELFRRLQMPRESMESYRRLLRIYSSQGFWAKAIAVGKVALSIDPQETSIQRELTQLYAKSKESKSEPVLEGIVVEEPKEKLNKAPLFSQMAPDEFMAVLDKMTVRSFPAGALICEEGDLGNSMFIISDGTLDVFSKDPAGVELMLGRLKEGDFFGEFGLLTNGTRNASVRAKTPCEVLEITSTDFDAIANRFPQMYVLLDQYLQKRMVHNILTKSEVFKHLSPAERESLASLVRTKKIPMGEVITEQGSSGEEMYFIKSGIVLVSLDKVVLGELLPGDYFGEVAMLTGKPRTATVRAKTDCQLFELKRADAARVFKTNLELLNQLKKKMVMRAEDAKATHQSYIESRTTFNLV